MRRRLAKPAARAVVGATEGSREMIDVPLSMKEIEVIRFVVERYRKAMLFEIAHTDSRDLKKHLLEREDLLETLVQKLDSFSGEPDTLSI